MQSYAHIYARRGYRVEIYHCNPGRAGVLDNHFHEEYQIACCVNFPGIYQYRGHSQFVPIQSLAIVHPGECHAARDPMDRAQRVRYEMLYIEPERIIRLNPGCVSPDSDRVGISRAPFFGFEARYDRTTLISFRRLVRGFEIGCDELEHEAHLVEFVAALYTGRFIGILNKDGIEARLDRVRDYLHDHMSDPIVLDDLAKIAGVSPFYLQRRFTRAIGFSPHQYLIRLRVNTAWRLIRDGMPGAQAAVAVGFADQSHLIRYFKRYYDLSPGRFRRQMPVAH